MENKYIYNVCVIKVEDADKRHENHPFYKLSDANDLFNKLIEQEKEAVKVLEVENHTKWEIETSERQVEFYEVYNSACNHIIFTLEYLEVS